CLRSPAPPPPTPFPYTTLFRSLGRTTTDGASETMIRIPHPFKKKESPPAPGQTLPGTTAPGSSPALTIDQLLEPLAARASYEYVGQRTITFRGIALRATRKLAGGQFVVLVDSHWGKRARKKFGYPDRTREQVVSDAHANGAAGFIVNEKLKGEPFLADKNCFFVTNTLDFVFRLVETVRAVTAKKV